MTDRLDAIAADLERPEVLNTENGCSVANVGSGDVRWLVGEIKWMRDALGECYQLTGADPDGNENWRLAPHAIEEVRRLRDDHDKAESALTALRQRHAAAVQKAYREGFGKGWGQGWDHGDLARPCDAAWLQSEAKARLT